MSVEHLEERMRLARLESSLQMISRWNRHLLMLTFPLLMVWILYSKLDVTVVVQEEQQVVRCLVHVASIRVTIGDVGSSGRSTVQ